MCGRVVPLARKFLGVVRLTVGCSMTWRLRRSFVSPDGLTRWLGWGNVDHSNGVNTLASLDMLLSTTIIIVLLDGVSM